MNPELKILHRMYVQGWLVMMRVKGGCYGIKKKVRPAAESDNSISNWVNYGEIDWYVGVESVL